jgi:hypothetical protein
MRSIALIGALLAGQGLASPLAGEIKARFSPAPTTTHTGPIATGKLPGLPFPIANGTNPVGPTGISKPGNGNPGWNDTTPMTTSTVYATNVYTVTSVHDPI